MHGRRAYEQALQKTATNILNRRHIWTNDSCMLQNGLCTFKRFVELDYLNVRSPCKLRMLLQDAVATNDIHVHLIPTHVHPTSSYVHDNTRIEQLCILKKTGVQAFMY